ncbi:MAG: nucleoid-associated protein, YbaB/EbfC family [Candidatus Margulisiibacteriota bacterium]|nr:MAG: hypothetical protein A2X43_10320 [Candidatus Margulisbacteria bacterium GWD2_39_127]OGI05426.1 MAG: hypothetical protein A2X42_09190 [Candidatus Margulisbacteria bacterium GWF2_38_17]OGI07836.1 MAG: hypothetical protein A2X41_11965 [Candidatus Margulisbacteria bacterium GWE2_39_32]PZM80108.1 MAG: nucleoid-associated protein, YbaB/EbfC family [Candidatus Margulisiibacteriota bacterium]HAR62628.1 nucleoid-associated protein, YbaB/EbfC family [Candidatus Margulisiibacteriota bacterium]
MFGKLGDLGGIMKQMKDLKKAQKELKKITAEVTKDNVKVVVNGEMKIVDLFIDEPVDVKKLQKTIKEAVNDAINKVQFDSAQKLSGMAGGLNIPGLS